MLQTFGEVAWVLELQKQPECAVAWVCRDMSGAQDVGTLALTSSCRAWLGSVPTILTPAYLPSASLCRQPACCLGNTSSTRLPAAEEPRQGAAAPCPRAAHPFAGQPPEQGVPCPGPNPEGALLITLLASRSCSGRATQGCRDPMGIPQQGMDAGGHGGCFG